MVGFNTEVSIENAKRFNKAFDEFIKKGGDPSVAFELIKDDFLKSNNAQFNLRGDGQYTPLSPKYKAYKDKRLGRKVPILNFTGRLKKSLTQEGSPDFIYRQTRNTLILGTRVPYANPIHFGAPKINLPARPIVFIQPEGRGAPSPLRGRASRWLRIIDTEMIQQGIKEFENETR